MSLAPIALSVLFFSTLTLYPICPQFHQLDWLAIGTYPRVVTYPSEDAEAGQ
jgi:hypothetical protein